MRMPSVFPRSGYVFIVAIAVVASLAACRTKADKSEITITNTVYKTPTSELVTFDGRRVNPLQRQVVFEHDRRSYTAYYNWNSRTRTWEHSGKWFDGKVAPQAVPKSYTTGQIAAPKDWEVKSWQDRKAFADKRDQEVRAREARRAHSTAGNRRFSPAAASDADADEANDDGDGGDGH